MKARPTVQAVRALHTQFPMLRRCSALSLKNRREPMSPLILKRASLSRPSGQWRDDDYDVLENGVVVGPHLLPRCSRPAGPPLVAVAAAWDTAAASVVWRQRKSHHRSM